MNKQTLVENLDLG